MIKNIIDFNKKYLLSEFIKNTKISQGEYMRVDEEHFLNIIKDIYNSYKAEEVKIVEFRELLHSNPNPSIYGPIKFPMLQYNHKDSKSYSENELVFLASQIANFINEKNKEEVLNYHINRMSFLKKSIIVNIILIVILFSIQMNGFLFIPFFAFVISIILIIFESTRGKLINDWNKFYIERQLYKNYEYVSHTYTFDLIRNVLDI